MPGCSLISATVGTPPSVDLLVLCDQLLDELAPPFLGALELVEGIDVKPRDPGDRIGDGGRQLPDQRGGRVDARQREPPHPAAVRTQEPRRLAEADPPRDLKKLAVAHRSGHPDPD